MVSNAHRPLDTLLVSHPCRVLKWAASFPPGSRERALWPATPGASLRRARNTRLVEPARQRTIRRPKPPRSPTKSEVKPTTPRAQSCRFQFRGSPRLRCSAGLLSQIRRFRFESRLRNPRKGHKTKPASNGGRSGLARLSCCCQTNNRSGSRKEAYSTPAITQFAYFLQSEQSAAPDPAALSLTSFRTADSIYAIAKQHRLHNTQHHRGAPAGLGVKKRSQR